MAHNTSPLSYNIRTLRKENNMSQEELAAALDIKRSNIAAYETKNVEPRLRTILDMARIFDVSVQTFIEKPIHIDSEYAAFDTEASPGQAKETSRDLNNDEDVQIFIEKSTKIKKVLEGFKAFYSFKKKAMTEITSEKERIIFDIDNFVNLMDYLLSYNDSVIEAIGEASNERKE